MTPNAFSIINRRVHRYPAIVSRARDEIPPDDVASVRLCGNGIRAVHVPSYSAAQLAKLDARIRELIDGQA